MEELRYGPNINKNIYVEIFFVLNQKNVKDFVLTHVSLTVQFVHSNL